MTSTTVAMRPPATTLIGALYVLGAGLSWSFTGALLRFAPHIDAWQIQTYRGLGTAVAFWLLAWQQGRPVTWAGFVVLGRLGPIVTVSLSVASIGFIVALERDDFSRTRIGIPKLSQIRFNMQAGIGGQHAWRDRFPQIYASGLLPLS